MIVLPYYIVYRALVRAKIALFRIESEEQSTKWLEEYKGYTTVAQHYINHHFASASVKLQPDSNISQLTGILIIITPNFCINELLIEQFGGIQVNTNNNEQHKQVATQIILSGFLAVVDGTSLTSSQRLDLKSLSHELKTPFLIVQGDPSHDVTQEESEYVIVVDSKTEFLSCIKNRITKQCKLK